MIQIKRINGTSKFSEGFGNPLLVGRKSAVINTDARNLEVGYQ